MSVIAVATRRRSFNRPYMIWMLLRRLYPRLTPAQISHLLAGKEPASDLIICASIIGLILAKIVGATAAWISRGSGGPIDRQVISGYWDSASFSDKNEAFGVLSSVSKSTWIRPKRFS